MKSPKNYLIDLDGVLVSGKTLISGAEQFIERLKAKVVKFLVGCYNKAMLSLSVYPQVTSYSGMRGFIPPFSFSDSACCWSNLP